MLEKKLPLLLKVIKYIHPKVSDVNDVLVAVSKQKAEYDSVPGLYYLKERESDSDGTLYTYAILNNSNDLRDLLYLNNTDFDRLSKQGAFGKLNNIEFRVLELAEILGLDN